MGGVRTAVDKGEHTDWGNNSGKRGDKCVQENIRSVNKRRGKEEKGDGGKE